MPRRTSKNATEDGALALIEKGFNLLKDTPIDTLACYFIGTLPFCLALLYFWMDMSRSPFAGNHQVLSAMGMAAMFFWMKCWHGIFVKRLALQVKMDSIPSMNIRERFRFGLRHSILQGSSLFMIPLSICLLVPFGWAYAFYQNCLYYGADHTVSMTSIIKQASKKAALWPVQNHFVIWLINPLILFLVCTLILIYLPNIEAAGDSFFMFVYLLVLASLTVFLSPLTVAVALNLLSLILIVPFLIRTLMGIETAASQNMDAMLNSSTLILLCCLVYLVLDPLVKATYVLRCFYGDSILSGEDIRARLLRIKANKTFIWILAATTGLGVFSPIDSSYASADVSAAQSTELSQNINEELEKPIYSWRLPRERKQTNDSSVASTLDEKLEQALQNFAVFLEKIVAGIAEWLDARGTFTRTPGTMNISWGGILQTLAWTAVLILLIAVLVMVVKHFKRSPLEEEDEGAEYLTPDLEDENISAEDLPVDEWVALAMEMFQNGDVRLAVRALFLSGLAFLGEQRFLQIRRFKSNREYLRELGRRAHGDTELNQAFEWSVNEFESIWYGNHEATSRLYEAFQENLQTIKREPGA